MSNYRKRKELKQMLASLGLASSILASSLPLSSCAAKESKANDLDFYISQVVEEKENFNYDESKPIVMMLEKTFSGNLSSYFIPKDYDVYVVDNQFPHDSGGMIEETEDGVIFTPGYVIFQGVEEVYDGLVAVYSPYYSLLCSKEEAIEKNDTNKLEVISELEDYIDNFYYAEIDQNLSK